MDSDSVMSDTPANASSTNAGESSSQQAGIKAAAWNTPKFREEFENAKQRLQHQEFSSSTLPEPVTMRPLVSRLPGEDPETIQRMQAIVADAKAKAAADAMTSWP
ncbi:hypothetical protein QBC42DRAFT_291926 [Cladorrhinum samala]|uniref:Uncharacterized protein n=1 Tax=Cladorrhinum samala TaxID=585594 RepID=A0AAV9H7S3_9PEZI|nr:hypothetical protein QBC42DRAFT_291926 [Cladorrhinum samala]